MIKKCKKKCIHIIRNLGNNIDMKNRYYTNYIVLSILFFLFLFSFSVYNLSQKHKQGTEKAILSFNRIKNSITTLYLSGNDFSSPPFKSSINDFFTSDRSLQSLVIYGNNGKIEYLNIKNPLILSRKPVFTDDFITKPEYKFNKFLFNFYTSSIIIPGNNNLIIETVYEVLGYDEISDLIKIAIIALLIYIILTSSFLLFVPYKKKKSKPENRCNEEEKNETVIKPEALPEPLPQVENNTNTTINYTHLTKEINGPVKTVIENTPPTFIPINIPLEEEPAPTTDDSILIKVDQKTGLANSEYFSPKLNNELNKAASNDIDLSLLILLVSSDDSYKIKVFYDNLSLLLRKFFMPQMSFSLSDKNKIAIIIPDKSVEESISKTDEFIGRLKNISGIENIYAGISSRNSRIISAERLIKEAEGALSKAVSGTEHVVAFKSDPEKYREMIAKQNPI